MSGLRLGRSEQELRAASPLPELPTLARPEVGRRTGAEAGQEHRVRFRDGDRDYDDQPTDEWWERFDRKMEDLWSRIDDVWED